MEPDGIGDQVIQGLSYEISWIDSDPDSNAAINLYLSTDPPSLGAQLNSEVIQEDSYPNVQEFSSAGFEPGRYYPIAQIQDEDSSETIVSPYYVEITRNATPTIQLLTPPETGAVVFGDTFEIRWIDSNSDNDPRDPAYVNLFYDTDDHELNGIRINSEADRSDG